MSRSLKRSIAPSDGFTLIELLVVISIIAILTTIAVPMFIGQKEKAMQKEAMTNLESIRMLEEQYFAEEGTYTDSVGTCAKNNPNNVTSIRNVMSGFKPGKGQDLYFSYCIEKDTDFDGGDTQAAADPYDCFRARAFGNSGELVDGTEFKVDCNNQKNY